MVAKVNGAALRLASSQTAVGTGQGGTVVIGVCHLDADGPGGYC